MISRLSLSKTALSRVMALSNGLTLPVLGLAGVSAAVGLAEGGVLVLIANVAAEMVKHSRMVRADVGPLVLNLTVGASLVSAFVLAGIRLILQLGVAWLPAKLSADVSTRIRRDLFEAYSGASWAVQSEERDGQFQELITGQVAAGTRGLISLANAVSAGVMFLVLLASALALNAFVAVVVLASSFLLFGVLRPIDRFGRRAATEQSHVSIEYAGAVSETVRLTEEAWVFGASEALRQRIDRLLEALKRVGFQTQFMNGLVQTTYQSAVILLIVGGLCGLYAWHPGQLATLGAVILVLTRASAYGQQLQAANHGIVQVAPYLDRLSEAMELYRGSAVNDGTNSLPEVHSLSLRDVRFHYRPGLEVLHGITFDVSDGETIGIIGPTAAGKSTLSQILLRLREPVSGTYLVNGLLASDVLRRDWQRRVAYVSQEPRIVSGTVTENIRFFRSISDDAVERAARLAHVHDDIQAMSHGYATIIGQRADAISGGQRQRICLARALAGTPSVLLLDEPTSSLDVISEMAVRESLAELRGRVILFIIAHRLPLLDICDRVLVLDKGRVQAFASVSDLADRHGFYRQVLDSLPGASLK